MKVLIVTPSPLFLSGIANFFHVLNGKFSLNVDYFIRGPKKENKYFRKFIIFFLYVINIFQFVFKVRKYDIVHLNTSLGMTGLVRDGIYLLLAKQFNKKVIVFLHGLNINMQNKLERNNLFRKVFFKADAFIVLSSEFMKKMKKWDYKKEIYLATTVVDDKWLNEFNLSIIEKNTHKNNKDFSILFVSRIIKEKGIFELLDGFQLLNKSYPDCKLIIVGNGKDLDKMVSYSKKNNIRNIEYTGYLAGVEKYKKYIDADVFILPSYTEGMPTVVIEAMAFGLPVIASNVGGIPDLIKSDDFGYILKDISPEQIKETLESLIVNPIKREQIAHHNHSFAKENLTASKFAKKLEDIYHSLDMKLLKKNSKISTNQKMVLNEK